jgi:hypothetical protein
VYAELASTDGGAAPWVVFGAHYESVTASPGADDNASGTAMELGIAEHVTEQLLALGSGEAPPPSAGGVEAPAPGARHLAGEKEAGEASEEGASLVETPTEREPGEPAAEQGKRDA